MTPNKIIPAKVSPEIYRTILEIDQKITSANSLNKELIILVKIYISLLNSCAFCINYHTEEAMRDKIDLKKLLLLSAFDKVDIYSEEEKLVFEWCKRLTFIKEYNVKESLISELSEIFNEKQIADLTYLVGLINFLNRLATSLEYKV